MNAPARGDAPGTCSVLSVPGMHCAGCMAKVERAFGDVDGVQSARANLTARSVEVIHDGSVPIPAIVEALARVGFEAQPREEIAPPPSAVKPLLAPLAVATFAAMNVMLLSVSVWAGADGATRALFHWISAAIAVPAIAYSGRPFFNSAFAAVRKWTTNMDVPISIGVIMATALSFYEVVTGGKDAWFDGTLMLLAFLLVGRVLDAMMRDRARAGVDALLRQAANGATVVDDSGITSWVDSARLLPGMTMRVASGERLAADGEIRSGTSRFDQSLLTGESAPVAAGPGDLVLAGTLNVDAPVDVTVTATGHGTALAEIAQLMEAASQSKSRYVRVADRAARLYAPAVHTLAALALVGWLIAGAGLYKALVIAIAVLIITCPCALGLAVPVAQVVAAGALMKRGIMVKDGSAIERMAGVERALLDKTGTLTLGRPVPDEAALDEMSAGEAGVALALASHSRHPLSKGLAAALAARGVRAAAIEAVHEEPGKGMAGRWIGRAVSLGRPATIEGTATQLVIEGEAPRVIRFADALRPDAAEALAQLAALGIEARIVSGDAPDAVAEVARETGLEGQGGVGPKDKQDTIVALQQAGHKVLMVGDGLNDGPALMKADASMAPGSASDVGLHSADLVFTGDSLLAIPRAVRAARRTMAVVRQNFALAVIYNLLAVPLALAGFVTPLIAAIAMSASSLMVVSNSLRLVRAAR
ncbi:MAG: cadmium-translocating P-type ATPase [Sphingomonadales bacterium]|nr:cadmium-translocating P-type ATPase [Sphingomonadales bacterium]MDE2567276.1 cadmium-translocating P-type ATPase [Sphingomonadales bacterium]